MVRVAVFALAASAFAALSSARPINRGVVDLTHRAAFVEQECVRLIFLTLLRVMRFTRLRSSYADFQISDGVGGQAKEQADAVFTSEWYLTHGSRPFLKHNCYAAPFAGLDLATVDSATLDAINTMREAAESAETDQFDPQIDAASGAEGEQMFFSLRSANDLMSVAMVPLADALQVGKIKNKVLKLTAEVQGINIKVRCLNSLPYLVSLLVVDCSGQGKGLGHI
jgi:hypothetical protein